ELTVDQKSRLRLFLEDYVSENKREQMAEVLAHRTRHVAVVLENVFQPHNAAAAIRSCECFGFQDLHIIELKYDHRIDPNVTMGGCKWVNLHRHRAGNHGTRSALKSLKNKGYRIVATSLRPGCIPLEQLDLSTPLALCFGTEEAGLSEEAHEQADELVQIPSYGFTQSFNVSVSVALSLSSIRNRLEASSIDWELKTGERDDLYLTWLMKTANRGLTLARHWIGDKV
ncbi:MAG: RNA methyltransferase, partial [Verrucomicrobiae bacterium]|nr:RNA methyltransferase [Verrucomicrobiae bacterium]